MGRKKSATLPPIDPQDFNLGPNAPKVGDSSGVIFHAIATNNVTKKLRDEVDSICRFYVDKYIWRVTKFIRYQNSKEEACMLVMEHANFAYLWGKAKPVVDQWKKKVDPRIWWQCCQSH